MTITVAAAKGSYTGQPLRRAYCIELPGTSPKARIKVRGAKAVHRNDGTQGGLVIETGKTDIRRSVSITVTEP